MTEHDLARIEPAAVPALVTVPLPPDLTTVTIVRGMKREEYSVQRKP